MRRDRAGVEKRQRSGEIRLCLQCAHHASSHLPLERGLRGRAGANFTGMSNPYEPPLRPEVVLHTDKETPEESAAKTLEKLEAMGYVPPARRGMIYTPQEEGQEAVAPAGERE